MTLLLAYPIWCVMVAFCVTSTSMHTIGRLVRESKGPSYVARPWITLVYFVTMIIMVFVFPFMVAHKRYKLRTA